MRHTIILTTDELTSLIGIVNLVSNGYFTRAENELAGKTAAPDMANRDSVLHCRAEYLKTILENELNGEEKKDYMNTRQACIGFVRVNALKIFYEAENTADKLEALKILERENRID